MTFQVKFFAGASDDWGFEVVYNHYFKSFTILFIHWYFGFEVWRDRNDIA